LIVAKNPSPPPVSSTAPTGSGGKLRLFLGLVCFLAWASVMVVEICAFRLMAPEFGNSVFTWTALIGVILVASSIGSYLGGYLADRRLALDMIGWLLAGAGVLIFFIPALVGTLGPRIAAGGSLIAGPVFASVIFFAVPGVLLGAVSPAAVRFYSLTRKDSAVGASAGIISMLGSLGSFVGTFLTGFVLISNFDVRSIFFGVALLLVLLALICFKLAGNAWKQITPILLAALFAAGIALSYRPILPQGVVYEENSYYHRIRVYEEGSGASRRRVLMLDNTQEGGINPETGALILGYQNFWRLTQLDPAFKLERALFLGAGAFGMPNELSRILPEAQVDVAEIDPRVIEVGKQFFQLAEHPRVNAVAEDARRYLRLKAAEGAQWDFIFGDAYNGIRAIPVHLTSREFFTLVKQCLTDDGVFVMNVISAVQGERSELLAGILATLRSVFPHVEAFGLDRSRTMPQNVILFASNRDWSAVFTERYYAPGSLQNQLVAAHVPQPQLPTNGPVFTDHRNPVDAIIARSLLAR